MKLLAPPLVAENAAARIGWFIRMRWLAALGVLAFAMGGRSLLQLRFDMSPLVCIAAVIVLYNTAFLLLSRNSQWLDKWGMRFATVQVATDIVALSVLMHLGGGVENPFLSYYLFHTIITAILLPWWEVILQVLFASVCIAVVAITELTGLMPHRHIEGLMPFELYDNWKFVVVAIFAVISTLCVTAFLAASIAERLRQREKELSDANAVLAEQDRIKSRYVMRVAHDLAEPTSMITSCLTLITRGLTGPISEKALDMVQRAQGKSEYLGHLIKDLLSLSRIKAAKEIPKGEVKLADVVNKVFEDVQPHVTEKNLTLEQNVPQDLPGVYGNTDAIHELLGNLITNAVKYTLVGGRVSVTASNTEKKVLVKVRDDGVGIPAEAIPHVFEEFYRADNVRAEAVEGTGLGLSIVSRILEVHGGEIWVESEEGQGTTFSFTLPVVGKTDE